MRTSIKTQFLLYVAITKGYEPFFRVLENEPSSVSENRFILTETASTSEKVNDACFNVTMSAGEKLKFNFTVESPLIIKTVFFSSSYPGVFESTVYSLVLTASATLPLPRLNCFRVLSFQRFKKLNGPILETFKDFYYT